MALQPFCSGWRTAAWLQRQDFPLSNVQLPAGVLLRCLAGPLTTHVRSSAAACRVPARLVAAPLAANPCRCPPPACLGPQADAVDIAYPPLVQSGGEYDLRLASASKDSYIHYGVIVCSLGAR